MQLGVENGIIDLAEILKLKHAQIIGDNLSRFYKHKIQNCDVHVKGG